MPLKSMSVFLVDIVACCICLANYEVPSVSKTCIFDITVALKMTVHIGHCFFSIHCVK